MDYYVIKADNSRYPLLLNATAFKLNNEKYVWEEVER